MTSDTTLSAPAAPITRTGQSALTAAMFLALAVVALLPNFIFCALFGPVGLGFIVVITIGAMFLSYPFAFALLAMGLFAQNLFAAIVLPITPGVDQFTPMLATSFINILLTSAFAGIWWIRARNVMPKENRMLFRTLALFFCVILAYSALGTASASLNDALIYMRVYLVGGLLLIIGLAFGYGVPEGYCVNVLRVMALMLAIWGVLEFLFTYDMYTIFNIADYIKLKYATADSMNVNNVEQAINFASRSWLNLSGALGLDFKVLRPQGPNIHPISYAYALSFGAIISYIYRSSFTTVLCLILLVLTGAKGPIIMSVLSISFATLYGVTQKSRLVLMGLAGFMVAYTAIGVVYGMYTEDYHVVGLMGGVKGFFSNPVGRGVGVGGNLSSLTAQYVDFGLFQGYGASFALESGFGVMIYQIGICTVFFLLFYWTLWRNVWEAALYFTTERRLIAIPCALGLLLVNSVFQEEAFSPAGWGPVMLLSGLLLARYWQQEKFKTRIIS